MIGYHLHYEITARQDTQGICPAGNCRGNADLPRSVLRECNARNTGASWWICGVPGEFQIDRAVFENSRSSQRYCVQDRAARDTPELGLSNEDLPARRQKGLNIQSRFEYRLNA